MLSRVERGESLLVLRHGRPIAEVIPIVSQNKELPSWKRPGLRLSAKGISLSATILAERDHESVS
jgi:antitoxin (DNA-binding transcriptional repressor) of toxin-antitoxin stability system